MHKVLIVDDEPLVRRLMRELFEDSGCELIEAANAAAGRAEAARTVPDVVLVDKNLPDGSGLDLIRALKESTGQTTNRAGQRIVERSLNVQPTITVRPGWPLRVIVHKDLVLTPYLDPSAK